VVYVTCRDQIVRLVDTDHRGQANAYECFFDDTAPYNDYHHFTFDLQTDAAGNFYFAKGANRVPWNYPHANCIVKVSPDGSSSQEICTGLRSPNGMGMGPHDEITVSDNQGHWLGACKVIMVNKVGGFYGFVGDPRLAANHERIRNPPAIYDPPLCYLPMTVDNSGGGQVWVPDARWGDLAGHMLHLSYGQSQIIDIVYEIADGVPQGGGVPFPLRFASGLMRGRFSPQDGQLYVVGIKGWETNAAKDGCLQRMRYTGGPVHMPSGIHIGAHGIDLSFTRPLDPASVSSDAFSIEEWNYVWSPKYGSPDLSLARPGKVGHDPVPISAATLSGDHRTVHLAIAGLRPVMQMRIRYRLHAADGAAIAQNCDITINVVPHD
jgi:hypothetical protein